MVISLGPVGPVHADVDGSRPLTSASNLIAVMSEIAAGRIALFSRPGIPLGRIGLCCSRRGLPRRQSGLSTRRRASPAFAGHPRSVQLGLSSAVADDDSDHPLALHHSIVNARRPAEADREGGDSTPRRRDVAPSATVPKGRLELPRVSSLRPERSASADSATSARDSVNPKRSRLGDSNPRPAVYETAALPAELSRQRVARTEG